MSPSDPTARQRPRGPADDDLRPRLVTIKTASRLLSVSRTKVYDLIDKGELRTVHIGVAVRIPLDEVDALIARLELETGGRWIA